MIRLMSKDFKESKFVTEIKSFTCYEKFNDFGTFTLELTTSYDNDLVKIGNYLISDSYQGIIQDIQFDDTSVTIHGYSLNWLLNYRCIMSEETYVSSKNATEAQPATDAGISLVNLVKTIVRDKPFYGFELVFDNVDFSVSADASCKVGDQLGDFVCKVCESAGIGNTIYISSEDLYKKVPKLHFKLTRGVDRSINGNIETVLFSTDMMSMNSMNGSIDYSNFKNSFIVEGEDLDSNRIIYTYTPELEVGQEYRYLYVSAGKQNSKTYDKDGNEIKTSDNKSVPETASAFQMRMYNAGRDKLLENSIEHKFNVEANATHYGTRYNLGDYVYCKSNKYGIGFSAQVLTCTQNMSSTVNNKTVTLGSTIKRYR